MVVSYLLLDCTLQSRYPGFVVWLLNNQSKKLFKRLRNIMQANVSEDANNSFVSPMIPLSIRGQYSPDIYEITFCRTLDYYALPAATRSHDPAAFRSAGFSVVQENSPCDIRPSSSGPYLVSTVTPDKGGDVEVDYRANIAELQFRFLDYVGPDSWQLNSQAILDSDLYSTLEKYNLI